jgi:hypothetical protein
MNNVDLSKLEQYRTPANAHLFEEAAGLFQEVNGGRPDTLPLPIPHTLSLNLSQLSHTTVPHDQASAPERHRPTGKGTLLTRTTVWGFM